MKPSGLDFFRNNLETLLGLMNLFGEFFELGFLICISNQFSQQWQIDAETAYS
ncbi:hypothetical protein L484_019192 [Morus notabilis]|uniref:Uncharacterized protein n=1 Tax=Morus notabilis TaxID=981085 RepID=W9R503_9ROSA|nr:hypothetical protein L484_019192 [Morus notabilis]